MGRPPFLCVFFLLRDVNEASMLEVGAGFRGRKVLSNVKAEHFFVGENAAQFIAGCHRSNASWGAGEDVIANAKAEVLGNMGDDLIHIVNHHLGIALLHFNAIFLK